VYNNYIKIRSLWNIPSYENHTFTDRYW